jgi:hypothetical protein
MRREFCLGYLLDNSNIDILGSYGSEDVRCALLGYDAL